MYKSKEAPSQHMFQLITDNPSLSTGASIALATVLTFLLTLVLGVSIGVFSVLGYQRCRRSDHSSSQTEMETPTAVVYEEPEGIKPDPQTQANLAYGHVQF